MHTTASDGSKTLEEALKLYKSMDYDFVCITDHWVHSPEMFRQGLLCLAGCEYDTGKTVQEGIYHILSVGAEREPVLKKNWPTPQKIVREILRAGGLPILAHPQWSLNEVREIEKIKGLATVEIYNAVSGLPWNTRPYSGGIVDRLASDGYLMHCTAADDTHYYQSEAGNSFVWVQAESLCTKALVEALKDGRFIATQGPFFEVERHKDHILVTCSPASQIRFYSDTVYTPNRVVSGDGLQRAEYFFGKKDTFVRVEVTAMDGKTGWSSPMAV